MRCPLPIRYLLIISPFFYLRFSVCGEFMSEEHESEGRSVRNRIEEVFARYEPGEEAVELPRVEAAPLERPPERVAPSVEVKPPSLVATGIPGLDNILGGGLPDHSVILVSGESGSHYETFVRQILYNHVFEGGKVAYYLAGSLSSDVMLEMESYGWPIREYVARGSWVFVNLRTPDLQQLADLTPRVLSEGFTLNLSARLNSLKSNLLEKIKEDRWTILEMNHLLNHYELNEVTSLLLYWRASARIYGGLHFTLLPEGIHPENYLNAIRHVADGALDFHLREGPREYETFMNVRKMRNIRRPLTITFTVTDEGIVIETAARIA